MSTSIYRYGKCRVGQSDGTLTVGSASLSFFPLPTKLFVTSTSMNDSFDGNGAISLFISGVGLHDERLGESVTLEGQSNVFTQNEYVFVDEVFVNAGNSNSGAITIYREDGAVVGYFEPRTNKISKANYFVTGNGLLMKKYGLRTRVDGRAEPVVVELVTYAGGRRTVIDTAFVDSNRSENYEREFSVGVIVSEGSLVSLEVSTDGSQVLVSGFIEGTEV